MELLTFEEAAEMFSVKVSTIKSWIARKQMPTWVMFKLPGTKRGTIRFIKSKLEEWIKDGCLQTQ